MSLSLSETAQGLMTESQKTNNLTGLHFESRSPNYYNSKVALFEHEGQRYILKTRKRFSDVIGFLYALINPYERYAPFSERIQAEKERLASMNALKLPVPTLMPVELKDAMVTRYLPGSNTRDFLKSEWVNFDVKLAALRSLSMGLSQIHQAGFAHGAPSAKNSRIVGRQGYWLDFGVMFSEHYTPLEHQAVDLEGFIYSASRNTHAPIPGKEGLVTRSILEAYQYPPVLQQLLQRQEAHRSFLSALIKWKKAKSASMIREQIIQSCLSR